MFRLLNVFLQAEVNLFSMVVSNFATVLGERRLKISKVSRETGISRSALTNLYYGRGSSISYEVLSRLCAYLDCTIGDILKTPANVREDNK